VLSVAPGTVVFAGPVAGTIYVTVLVAGGRKVTYGDVRGLTVRPGDRVAAGQLVAHSTGRLLLSVRLGATYLDPAPLLGHWEGRPRLLPTDGAPPRPAPMPRFACATGGSGR
jgi:murein DD-endopeptidase MepM/ murein hydrolase activator NlpD